MSIYPNLGEVSQRQIDDFQIEGKYNECYNLYMKSSLDRENGDTRKIKEILYEMLYNYLVFDPELKEEAFWQSPKLDVSAFEKLSNKDPRYVEKMRAVLLVMYYCQKNRSFNYVFTANASHCEVSKAEYLRDWLESNYNKIVGGYTELEPYFAQLMVLLYDKVTSATVGLFHQGKKVPTGMDIFNFGSFAIGETRYKDTSFSQKINALKLLGNDQYRRDYMERRNCWISKVANSDIRNSKNTFLYGTYDLDELNNYLSVFNFKLYSLKTKYYEQFFCTLPNGLHRVKQVFFLLTNNEEKYNREMRKNRDWPLSLILMSLIKVLVPALVVAVLFTLLFSVIGLTEAVDTIILICILIFMTPPLNRLLEKGKRKEYSLFK